MEGTSSSPTASAGCSTSATSWPSSARISSSRPNSSCWRPSTKGTLGELLRGADQEKLEAAIDKVRGGKKVDDANAEENRQALEKYTIDLTERAEPASLDPVIGRDDEIRRTIQVLQRRTKNNPVLIGAPGVGKTAIVEGWPSASSMAKCRKALKNKRVLSWTWGPWWPEPIIAASSRSA